MQVEEILTEDIGKLSLALAKARALIDSYHEQEAETARDAQALQSAASQDRADKQAMLNVMQSVRESLLFYLQRNDAADRPAVVYGAYHAVSCCLARFKMRLEEAQSHCNNCGKVFCWSESCGGYHIEAERLVFERILDAKKID